MGEDDNQAPGISTLLRRVGQTTLGTLQNRAELLAVEWQEEKARLAQLLIWSLGLLFLALMTAGLVTAIVILLLPQEYRVWGLAGFAILYGAGCLRAFFTLKALLNKEPFPESIEQVRKDVNWLENEE